MDGISMHVLGDNGPFSRVGKSVGYRLQIGQSVFLLDCGAPLFQQIGGHGLKEIEGLIITHCHDDHKRWFGDLALFFRYAPDMRKKLRLFTTEAVYYDLREASIPALTKGLSDDSKTITDVAFEDFIDYRVIGPRARYRIVAREEGNGKFGLAITDRQGNALPPDGAKIIINHETKKPRMLFRDPAYGEWIEPESFYSFSSSTFYEEDKNIYSGDNYTIEAINAPVWHGVACTGVKIKKGKEALIFSSDTVHDKWLWRQLCSEKRPQELRMSKTEFESASIIYGDINDYIERIWSEERYAEAINAFEDAAVIHDISARNSVVHTDYERLKNTTLNKDRSLLAQCPDRFTSEWALCNAGKTYIVKGGRFHEVVGHKSYLLNGDIYHKEQGKYYVGYKSDKGRYTVYRQKGLLNLAAKDATSAGLPLYKVDLYEDISGGYFPALDDTDAAYFERSDGKVEIVKFHDQGSNGKIVEDQRERLAKARDEKPG
jgi:glyoxylase-like metal-dependent hydrolase (beta-lactamase superfamily II)